MALLQQNIGTFDKAVRAIIAVVLFSLAYHYESWVFGLFGLFTVFEVVFSWCVFYQIIGRNTHCPLKKKK